MPNQHPAYSPQEKAYLLAHYATASKEEIMAAVPGRIWTVIQNQASKLGASGREKFIPKMKVSVWDEATTALLLAHYPLGGSAKVAALTGLTQVAIRAEASRRKLAYVCMAKRPKQAKKPKAAAVKPVKAKVAPRPAPKPQRPALPLLSVKRSPGTPVLNLQKEARKKKEQPNTGLSDAIARHKQLPYGHPEHLAFLQGGLLGWKDYLAKQPT